MTQPLTLVKWLVAALVVVLVLAITTLKAGWLEHTHIDAVAKAVSGFGLVAAGIWAIVTYYHNKRQEFQKTFNDRQIEIIVLTANTVGDLVGMLERKEWDQAVARFWELYWGRLVLFEHDKIIKKMMKLGSKLQSTSYEQRANLAAEVYDVSVELRTFLKESNEKGWRISFAELDEKDNKRNSAHKFRRTLDEIGSD